MPILTTKQVWRRVPTRRHRGTLSAEAQANGWPGAIGGKPRDASDQPSVYQISVRVTAEERELWLAAGEGSLANWMRTTLTERCARAGQEQALICPAASGATVAA